VGDLNVNGTILIQFILEKIYWQVGACICLARDRDADLRFCEGCVKLSDCSRWFKYDRDKL
jgi:hypothetical protein